MTLRFYNDRIVDVNPSKYQNLKVYLDGVMRDEKERDFMKKLFIRVN